jgi:hypothetical protein
MSVKVIKNTTILYISPFLFSSLSTTYSVLTKMYVSTPLKGKISLKMSRGNQNPQIEGQTTQWSTEIGQTTIYKHFI